MTLALAVRARFVLVPPCFHHGVAHQRALQFALTFVLGEVASRCTDLHGRHIASGLSGSVVVLDLVSPFCDQGPTCSHTW